MTASAIALTFGVQNFAWAVCSDGSTFPGGGYVVGKAPIVNPSNFSPGIFTGTAGSQFVYDTSTNEFNDPSQPLTFGGHEWVNDQGSTLCKETFVVGADGSTNWSIPPNTPTDCIVYPNIIAGKGFVNLGPIPTITDTITPTCDPTKLSKPGLPNPQNTYFNQLGCAISAFNNGGVVQATDAHTASSFLFGAGGQRSGSFINKLDNVVAPVQGGEAGKVNGPLNWLSNLPIDQIISMAAVSNDGMLAIYSSNRRGRTAIYACLNPLGDPGDPTQPLDALNFFVPPGNLVSCMVVGNSGLAQSGAMAFGPDNQPYVGGQRIINTFNATPGGPVASAWPQCIYQGDGGVPFPFASFPHPTVAQLQANLKLEFAHNSQNHCGNMTANGAFTSALVTQPTDIKQHKGDLPVSASGVNTQYPYMYSNAVGGFAVQVKVTQSAQGFSQYKFRTYITGTSIETGIGIAQEQFGGAGALIVMSDPSTVGLAGQEVLTRLPLCEDIL